MRMKDPNRAILVTKEFMMQTHARFRRVRVGGAAVLLTAGLVALGAPLGASATPPPEQTVSGIAYDGFGQVLGGAQVWLEGVDDLEAGASNTSTTSSGDGTFTLMVPDGNYTLCVFADDGEHERDDSAECGDVGAISVAGAAVTGLRVAVSYAGTAPAVSNQSALSIAGLRAVGSKLTLAGTPSWPEVAGVLAFDYNPNFGVWTRDFEMIPDAWGLQLTVRAADLPVRLGLTLQGTPRGLVDLDAGSWGYVNAEVSLAKPAAPAATSDALSTLPNPGAVTKPSVSGGKVTVAVSGHDGDTVDGWVYSTPVYLGQATVTAGHATFALPSGLAAGTHTVALTDSSGDRLGWATLEISNAPKSTGGGGGGGGRTSLEVTGGATAAPLAFAGGLLLLGGASLLLRRRRTV